ncbi:hypothetical protein T11_13040, partial [Trichinella zimbabwensis]
MENSEQNNNMLTPSTTPRAEEVNAKLYFIKCTISCQKSWLFSKTFQPTTLHNYCNACAIQYTVAPSYQTCLMDEHLAYKLKKKVLIKKTSSEEPKSIPAIYVKEGYAASVELSTSGQFSLYERKSQAKCFPRLPEHNQNLEIPDQKEGDGRSVARGGYQINYRNRHGLTKVKIEYKQNKLL